MTDPGRNGGEGTGLVSVGCFHELAVCDGAAECLNCGKRWIDPVTARDTIARAVREVFDATEWNGWDGWRRLEPRVREAVLAALASQERGE